MIFAKTTSSANFNPRSPHGERRRSMPTSSRWRRFQSTLPARGATRRHCIPSASTRRRFQSTLPARGATSPRFPMRTSNRDFNPRSPHGERRAELLKLLHHLLFQSTLPARGATMAGLAERAGQGFQSTLPARGATRIICLETALSWNFNPRSPHGERPKHLSIRAYPI